jgi:hypothetical protein
MISEASAGLVVGSTQTSTIISEDLANTTGSFKVQIISSVYDGTFRL